MKMFNTKIIYKAANYTDDLVNYLKDLEIESYINERNILFFIKINDNTHYNEIFEDLFIACYDYKPSLIKEYDYEVNLFGSRKSLKNMKVLSSVLIEEFSVFKNNIPEIKSIIRIETVNFMYNKLHIFYLISNALPENIQENTFKDFTNWGEDSEFYL